MLTRLIDDIKSAPAKLRNAPERLAARPVHMARSARHQAYLARGEAKQQLWQASTQALESAEELLGRAPENLPVVSRVADVAEGYVHRRLEAHTAVPIEDFGSLNARNAVKAVAELDRLDLLRARHIEATTKGRKTVLGAIDKALNRLNAPPAVLRHVA